MNDHLADRPEPAEDPRPVLVLGPNPTPNGGMHLGHLAGPYLAADVYARYQRALGRDVLFTTTTDDSQTYVTASAARQGISREELCRRYTREIHDALVAMGISFDGFGPYDDVYRETVLTFFRELHAKGAFKLRTVQLPYREDTGEFMVEGLIEGECPVCLTTCRGGQCETCGHANNYAEMIQPHSTIDRVDIPTTRSVRILVLPLEEWRDQLTAYHERWSSRWRPHIAQLMREVLARPLPDIPVTYPLDWGLPAPFPETPGQVLNAWLEVLPAGMAATAVAARNRGRVTAPGDLWRAETGLRIVHVLGYDNAFLFGIPDIALLLAYDGRYVLPEWVINNEFYELESEKFSTSRGHVVSGQDLLREVPRDVARLYLALTSPQFQRTTFSRVGLAKVAEQRLVGPWNQLAAALGKAVANAADSAPLPVSEMGRWRVATMLDRVGVHYEVPTLDLNRAADNLLVQIDRLARRVGALDGQPLRAWGDLFLETKALIAAAGPLLIDMAAAARESCGIDGSLARGAYAVTEVRPFAPPLLPTGVDP